MKKNSDIEEKNIDSYVRLLERILTESNWDTPKPIDSINSFDELYNLIYPFAKSNPGQLGYRIDYGSGKGRTAIGHFIDALKASPEQKEDWEQLKKDLKKSDAKSTSSSAGNGLDLFDDELGNTPDDKTKEKKYAELLSHVYNIVLHGAPGTGKTYLAKEIARELGCDKNAIKMVQFHPSYDYTDFMEGLRPVKENGNIGFERRDGAFKAFCKKALGNPEKKYIFIIDEINRGEISKILGECMFSIDPGYVGEEGKIETQYQNLIDDDEDSFKNGFYRPDNVYIIGTMNDIDRGVESMDLAMRRRFTFIEIKAEDTMEEILDELKNDKKTAERVMTALNEKIKGTEGLGEDYCIGASYFLKLDAYDGDDDKWERLWDNHLKSLLKEYVRGLENSSLINDLHETYWEEILDELKNDKETAKRVMIALNEKIQGTEGLGEDYCIGASYFLKLKAYGDDNKWERLWNNHLKSLLKEYVRGLENSSLIDDLQKTYWKAVYWEAVKNERTQESNLPNDADTVSATETETSDEQN